MKTFNIYPAVLILLFNFFTGSLSAQVFGEIRGMIKDDELEIVPYATIKILQGSLLIGGTQSDEQGAYKYKPLTPGSYEVAVMEAGHITQQVNKVKVNPNETTYLDISISLNTLGTVTVTAKPIDYTQSGVDINMYTMKTIDGKDLINMSGYTAGDIQGAITSLVSDAVQDQDGVHFRGTRGDASSNYVDGVKLFSQVTVPSLSIENLTIFSGGVPAMYGDVMGGLIVVTTKSYFSGIRDKNIRNAEYRERAEANKREKAANEEAQKRKKEIEEEKAKGSAGK